MQQEQPYTKNPKLDRFLTGLEVSLSDVKGTLEDHTKVHTQILLQTTATNGKVADIQKWRERMSGAVVVCAFIIPTVFGMIGWMAYEITHFDERIQDALSAYEQP